MIHKSSFPILYVSDKGGNGRKITKGLLKRIVKNFFTKRAENFLPPICENDGPNPKHMGFVKDLRLGEWEGVPALYCCLSLRELPQAEVFLNPCVEMEKGELLSLAFSKGPMVLDLPAVKL